MDFEFGPPLNSADTIFDEPQATNQPSSGISHNCCALTLGAIFGDNLGDTFGDNFGEALGEAFGEAFGDVIGPARESELHRLFGHVWYGTW